MPLFRNRNENQDESPALEENRRRMGAGVSMRERPVPATMPIEDDDGPDAQLEFLQGLVSIKAARSGRPRRQSPRPAPMATMRCGPSTSRAHA